MIIPQPKRASIMEQEISEQEEDKELTCSRIVP